MRTLIFVAVLGLVGCYVWWRLVRTTQLQGRARIAVTLAVILPVLPILALNFISGSGPPRANGWFAWPVFVGWALFGFTFLAVVLSDLGRILVWLVRRARRSPAMDPSRRQALARITGGVVGTAVVGHVGFGMIQALGDAEVVDVPVTLDRLPRALDGFTIVQLTDVHVGGTIGRTFVSELVARTNALAPDLIALTGDFVDGSVDELREAVAPLAELRAPHGVFFVTGNHEYHAGAEPWVAHFETLGIRVLRNARASITRDGASFELAGIEDHAARRYGRPADLARALAGRDPARAVVLLAHQPRQVHEAAKHGVDLQLSGHTHGGQVWPWHYLVAAQQGGLLAGRYTVANTQLYVSRGPSYWGPPVRVVAPPEITRVNLRAGTPRATEVHSRGAVRDRRRCVERYRAGDRAAPAAAGWDVLGSLAATRGSSIRAIATWSRMSARRATARR
ncbi:MAG: metallophosphoesterase [Kofleriaceae bacterium]